MTNTYQQCFQQPQWNVATGAQLVDATINVTLVGITQPLPAGTNQLGTVTIVGAIPAGTNLIGNAGQVLPAGATPFNVRATSGANAAVTATQAAGGAGHQNYLLGYQVCLRGAAAAADAGISVKDDSTEKLYDVIGSGAAPGTRCKCDSQLPLITGTANKALTLTVGAAGAGAITEVSMWGYVI